MKILIPATGSYNVTVKCETAEGYVCVGSRGYGISFVYREYVKPNTEGFRAGCYADCGGLPTAEDDVAEMYVPSEVVWDAVDHNAGEILDKLMLPPYIPTKD